MEDKEVVWGKPDLNEIREYFTTQSTHVDPRTVFLQETPDSSIELDESFKTILEKQSRKVLDPEPNEIVEKTADEKNTNENDENNASWMNCGDETFLNMEKLCEKTVLERSIEVGHTDVTQLNDVEPPSFLWEQTTVANFPKNSPMKLVEVPSTILEESTYIDSIKGLESSSETTSENISEEKRISLETTLNESFKTAENQTYTGTKDDESDLHDQSVQLPKENENVLFSPHKELDISNTSKSSSTEDMNLSSTDNAESLHFNDTLEEMDFIMKHGIKFIEKQQALNETENSQNVEPEIKSKPLPTNSKTPSKNLESNFDFKKPLITSFPLPKSNSKKFEHIASPIHAYIKNSAQYPLMTKQKGRTGLIDQLHDPTRRETVYHNKDLLSENLSYESPIPLKGVVSAPKSQYYDARTPTKIPGGEKMHKLIGKTTPTVIKHEGHFKSYANVQINANNTIDDSMQDLSIASADVSIKVLKNVNRP